MRDRTAQDKEENDRTYRLSQEQRKLERDIRYAQRKAAMLDAAGDTEGFDAEALKIKNAQAKYNAFCKQTGRAKRLDRTRVYEYNNNIDNKVSAAAKRRELLETALRNAPVKLPDNTLSKITEGAKISGVETFAGKGSNKELRVKNFLVQNYGGRADEWQHSKARTYIDTSDGPKKAVIHWFYEQSVGAKETFVKGWSKK